MRKQILVRIILGLVGIVAAGHFWVQTPFLATAQGSQIAYGETVNGDITADQADESWFFTGSAGDVIAVRLTRTDGNLSPSLSLTDSKDTLLVGLEWPDPSATTALFKATLRSNGRHMLSVQAAGSDTAGRYALNLELEKSEKQAETSHVLSYGQVSAGTITDQDYRHFWYFRGTRSDVVDVVLTPLSGDLIATVALISPQGEEVTSTVSIAASEEASLYALALPATGTYTIAVSRMGGEDGESQGEYDLALSLRREASAQVQTPINELALGTSVRVRLTADAPSIMYSIRARGVVSIGLDPVAPLQTGVVSVVTPEGALLGTFSGAGSMRSSVRLSNQNSSAWIEITTQGIHESTPVDFVLTVDELTTAQRTSQALVYNKVRSRSATPTSEPANWHFLGHANDLVTVEITPYASVLSGTVRVTDPNGQVLIEQVLYDELIYSLALKFDGLYEIFVDPQIENVGYQIEVNRIGVAGLAFDQRSVPQPQGFLTPGAAVQGDLSPGASHAWFIDVTEPQLWQFQLSQIDSAFPIALSIEAPDGSWSDTLVPGRAVGIGYLDVLLPGAGRYKAIVFDPARQAANVYSLQGSPIEGGTIERNTVHKGVLKPDAPRNQWKMNVQAGTLLNVNLNTLSGGSAPDFQVIGPDGLAVASSPSEDALNRQWGILVSQGGWYAVVVSQPIVLRPVIYHITVDIVTPFDDQVLNFISTPLPEVFVVEPSTNSQPERVNIPEQIAPRIKLEQLASARTIEPGSLSRGELIDGEIYQVWSFSAASNQALGFSVVGLEDYLAPNLLLLQEDGSILAEKYQHSATTNYLMYRFARSGTYYVAIGMNGSGRYTLWVDSLLDIDETVPDVSPDKVMTYGDTASGEILDPNSLQQILFYGYAGDIVSTRVASVYGKLRPRLSIPSAEGEILGEDIANSTSGTASVSDLRLPRDGIYHIQVAPEDNTTGRFVVHLDLALAKRGSGLLIAEQYAGLDAANSQHRWLFSANAAERVTVRVEPLTSEAPLPLSLQLADTAGHVFLQRNATLGQGALELSNILLPRSGAYQAVVQGGQTQAGLYRITLQRDPAETPGVMTYGQSVGQVLTQENFLDVWTFAGSSGDEVSILARPLRGDPLPIGIQVRTQDGQVLATTNGDSTRAAIDSLVLPVSGYYSVVIGSLGDAYDGETAYELTVLLRATSARSMGTQIEYDQIVHGGFFVDDLVDTWLFEGKAGDIITIEAAGRSPELKPLVSLLATDWHLASSNGRAEVLATAQGLETNPAQIRDFMLPASGSYALRVENMQSGGGIYDLTLAGESVNSIGVNSIVPDRQQEGQISAFNLVENWVFEGTKDSLVTIDIVPGSQSSLAPVITLVDTANHALTRSEASPKEKAQITDYRLPQTGSYTIQVTRALGAQGQTEGRYVIELHQSQTTEISVQQIVYGKVIDSRLDEKIPAEHWQFTGHAGDVIRLHTEVTSGDLDCTLRLYDEAGVLLSASDDANGVNPEITFRVEQDGRYDIEVARYNGALGTTTGNYALLLDRVYSTAPVSPEQILEYGSRVVGNTDAQNPDDTWFFFGETGDVVHAAIQFPLDDAPLTLALNDPAGNPLAVSTRDKSRALIDRFSLPASGFYALAVRRPGDARLRYTPYTLDVDLLDTAPLSRQQGGTLIWGDSVSGYFDQVPATHTWLFRGVTEQLVSFVFSRLEGPLALHVTLLAPNGTPLLITTLDSNIANTLTTQPVMLPADGNYTLLISGDTLGLDYRLSLQTKLLPEATAAPITPLEDGFGVITNIEPVQWWSFTASAGDVIFLRAGTLSGDLEPRMLLHGTVGEPLIEGVVEKQTPYGNQAVITDFVVPESGTYLVSVSRAGNAAGSSVGNYRLMLRTKVVSAAAATATDIAFNTQIAGYTYNTEAQYYAFQGLAGDVIAISARVSQGESVPQITLQTENTISLDAAGVVTDAEASIPVFRLPQDGRYLIEVQGQGTEAYELSVIKRTYPDQLDGPTRNLGRQQDFVDSILDPATPTRWIFPGQMGEVVTFTVDTTGGTLQPDISLFGPDGRYLNGVVGQAGSRITTLGPVRLPDNGSYTLVIGSWMGAAGGSSGRYTVNIASAEGSGSAGGTISGFGIQITGGLTPSDNVDTWSFTGQAGTLVSVRAEQRGGTGQIGLHLLNPEESVVVSGVSTEISAEIVSFMLPETGVYSVMVQGEMEDQEALEYGLIVDQIKTPILASLEQSQSIQYGVSQPGSLPDSGVQAWVFYGQMGEKVAVEIALPDSNWQPTLYLVDPAGCILKAAQSMLPGSDLQLTEAILPQSGFYGLVVKAAAGSQSNQAYTLLLQKITAGAALQGQLNGPQTASLTARAPIHEWILPQIPSGRYAVTLTSTSDSVPGLFVQAEDGSFQPTELLEDNMNKTAVVELEGAHLYHVVVTSETAASQGYYALDYMPASVVLDTELLMTGQPDVGRLTNEHFTDEWRVQVSNAGTFSAAVTRISGNLMPVLALYNENGVLITQSTADENGLVSLEVELDTPGLYRMQVSREAGGMGTTSGDYTIITQQ